MNNFFLTILNMSLTAGFVAIAVMLVRLLLKKTPKIFSYVLWTVVLFRLLCPFTFESPLSLMPHNTETISQDIVYSQNPVINSGIGVIDNTVYPSTHVSLPPVNPSTNANPIRVLLEIGSIIWILGIATLLSYMLITYLKLKYSLSTAILVCNNIYETDRIKTPLVLGLIKPRIIIPLNLSDSELGYIIKHEQTHIKRYDYIIKPIAFLALTVHWFNPIIWLSYFLMVKDMEMSCDESVVKHSNEDIRANYSNSLLSISTKQSGIFSPLAFGESNVKSRIKNVLSYKRPTFWVIIVTIMLVVAVSVGLMSNPADTSPDKNIIDSEQLTNFAMENINQTIANYELNPEIKIIKSKITRLELVKSFETLSDTPIYVYALEYRLLPNDTNKVFLAGGMQLDEKGWLKETCSMGSPLLVVSHKAGSTEHIGTICTGTVDEEGGFESAIKNLLASKSEKPLNSNGSTSDNADKSTYIDDLLSEIMSSPSSSSMPGDYIKAHQEQFNLIVSMKAVALPYLIEILDSKDRGLRGNIVALICENIIKNIRENQDNSSETDKLVEQTLTSIKDWKIMMGYDSSRLTKEKLLWTKDSWNYYIETLPRGGSIPLDNHVGQLYRQKNLEKAEVLDKLVLYRNNSAVIFPAGDRIVFMGFAGTSVMDFKTNTIVSIMEDGSYRKTYSPKFNVANQLCYDNGYLYYEGWTNDRAFPRPLNRLNTDLTKDIKMADIDGSLITVYNGYAYYLNDSIYRLRLDWASKPEICDKTAIGKNIVSVQKIADNEYNVFYDNTNKPYILRLMDEKRKAFNVVQKYFTAFENSDYKSMSALSTDNHNNNLVHNGDVWGMKWARAKEIKLVENPSFLRITDSKSTLVYEVSVDMETVKTSSQYPSTQTSIYVILIKSEDGVWQVDTYTTG